MYILGINSVYHESSACLIKDGILIAAVEEERFNRIKHAKAATIENVTVLPYNAIDFCLNKAEISMADVDYIGYSFEPETRYEKNREVEKEIIPGSWGSEDGEKRFLELNQQVVSILEAYYQVDLTNKFMYLSHHMCHLASAFFVSPYKDAALLCVDGIGEFESTTLARGNNNTIEPIARMDYPHSLGFLWEHFSEYLGFSEYDACKVMGLASYGDHTVYEEMFKEVITYKETGFFTINTDVIKFRLKDFTPLEALFGPKRERSERYETRHQDIAAALQHVTEEILIRLARFLQNKTGLKKLCIAGGVGLNCVANGIMIENTEFDNVWVQPGANDAGTAIGAAYVIWNQILERPRTYVMKDAYLGPEYSSRDIKNALDASDLVYTHTYSVERETAKLIAEGNIIGWFQGRLEFGPRALGNRSLLADPRNKDMKDILNLRVKHREPFRPFCPSVLGDRAHSFFGGKEADARKYMLAAVDVVSDRIPSVTHIDGTARVQEVDPETNPKYYILLNEFEKLTGVGVLINTSFNDCEPIVCSPEDAIQTFLKTDIDYLVIGDFILSKKLNEGKIADSELPQGSLVG